MTTTDQPRKRMPRAERERQMMAVAEEIFSERGYLATSVDEIAERCGVSKPMIYEYFGSKEGLLVACIRAAREELAQATTAAVVGATTPEEALRRGVGAFFAFADSHRRAWSLMLSGDTAAAGPVAAAEIEAGRQEQAAIDVALFRAFVPDAPQTMLEAAAQVVVGACERLSLWYVAQDEVGAEEAADYLMTSLWHGLRGLIERAHPAE
ncbi:MULTISPECIES: TetR/AcrR family transcriptional regulator [Actinokineospora]|uniref:TetR family transcriptional regulator n=1 Tax=Actinokineospora fastidiosa TaxID=1816 RepID=A0A918GJY2_9PSEU|nr:MULTISPECIES: TetR/AcrR family transcriptional regulator [Actinokineospora]UVS77469.1 HTH-type transcriptional regulator EthR [Actinokineospora sp. UTMC 2448]GGS43095.1 TetR family transcriptional regulator [Actinokineospora fastidiosa]